MGETLTDMRGVSKSFTGTLPLQNEDSESDDEMLEYVKELSKLDTGCRQQENQKAEPAGSAPPAGNAEPARYVQPAGGVQRGTIT